jgi:branched-chain amino acid transport system ATP-binding protein
MGALLELHDVHAAYGLSRVLFGISLDVAAGECVCLLGRNGVGKTTTIRSVMGLLRPTSGRVLWKDTDIAGWPPHRVARAGIGFVPEDRRVFAELTVWENLEMGRIAGGGSKRSRMDEVFDYFPRLKERTDQQAGTLSGGEQQMLAIGRALMTLPKLVLLDEPSDGVMPIIVRQIADIMVRINREERITIVIVEQNVPMVFSVTDHFAIIEKGRVVAEGSRDAIANSEVMKEYLAI